MNVSSKYIAIGLILAGSALMMLAIFTTRKLFNLFTDKQSGKDWHMLYRLMIFFFIGYLFSAHVVANAHYSWLGLLTGTIYLFGAAFVYLVVRIGLKTIKKLNKTNSRLLANKKELELRNSELEQLSYIASHDLQEPLNTIINFSELLEQPEEIKLEDRKKYRHFISQSANRMSDMINELLNYSRIGIKDKNITVDCNTILKMVLDDLSARINETNATFSIGNLPKIKIKVKETELRLLFQNILSNAIKFRKQNINPYIIISSKKINNYWEFSFADNGIGLPEKNKEKIFEVFKRLHSKDEYEGTGIGLAHCRKIVTLLGGKIWVESKLNLGSTFYFTIPA